jgi:putrescine aminotransferase
MSGGIREQIREALQAGAASVSELHARHLNPTFIEALGLFGFRRHYVRAEGLSLWDDQGREVLDFLAGYGAISLGHNHPDVRGAIEEVLQACPPQFLLVAPPPLAAELARRLISLAPCGLDLCFFGSSGSEAVEGALKLARLATKRKRFVSAERSYHGTTLGALAVTGSERHRRPFEPLLQDASFVPFADTSAIEAELRRRDVAAVILEPMQGEGGMHPAPAGYLKEVSALCLRYGALLVLDEVQTGLGRCGRMFACEEEGVEPDVILLAKGLSGGLVPISALITRKSLWQRAYGTLERYDLHCSTFGGGALACAAALATLEVIRRDGLVEAAAQQGEYLLQQILAATAGHPLIKEVRGRGLLLGIELDAPAGKIGKDLAGQWLVVGLLERGMLVQVCADAAGVVRVQPPLTVTREAIDRFAAALKDTLAEHATGRWKSVTAAAARAVRTTTARAFG